MLRKNWQKGSCRGVGSEVGQLCRPGIDESADVINKSQCRLSGAQYHLREPSDPPVELAGAELVEARQVPAGVPGYQDADRRRERDSHVAHDGPGDQGAADPTVAVAVGVNGLELRVEDGGLGDR